MKILTWWASKWELSSPWNRHIRSAGLKSSMGRVAWEITGTPDATTQYLSEKTPSHVRKKPGGSVRSYAILSSASARTVVK